MAISVGWATDQVITIPRADMPIIQVSPEVRELDTAQFWLDLKDEERTADGMPWPDTQSNNPSYTISGVVYAQGFLIIPPYSITFEDGQYAVSLKGTNNNIIDVANSNQVRILGNNSAGLQLVSAGSGLSTEQDDRLRELWQDRGFDASNELEVDESAGTVTVAGIVRKWSGAIQKKFSRISG